MWPNKKKEEISFAFLDPRFGNHLIRRHGSVIKKLTAKRLVCLFVCFKPSTPLPKSCSCFSVAVIVPVSSSLTECSKKLKSVGGNLSFLSFIESARWWSSCCKATALTAHPPCVPREVLVGVRVGNFLFWWVHSGQTFSLRIDDTNDWQMKKPWTCCYWQSLTWTVVSQLSVLLQDICTKVLF